MKRIRSLYRRARHSRPGLRADLGFAMITVIGYGVIIVLIAVQIRGERRQNKEYRERLLDQ